MRSGVGIVEFPVERDVPVALFVDLDMDPTRLPMAREERAIAGVQIPVVGLSAGHRRPSR